MTRCLLALGANLGDRAATLRQTLELIAQLPATQLLARSTWHETAPVGGPAGQASFLNGAVLLDTTLEAPKLARDLQKIETLLGRNRQIRWDARTIDIDILLFGEKRVDMADLQIPHPRMAFRQFVLAPAAEIAGDMRHPPVGWTIAALSSHWRTAPRQVALVGQNQELLKWLSDELSRKLLAPARYLADPKAIKLVSCDEQPALVIALDESDRITGPVARITSGDRAEILQEIMAAVQAAWPDG